MRVGLKIYIFLIKAGFLKIVYYRIISTNSNAQNEIKEKVMDLLQWDNNDIFFLNFNRRMISVNYICEVLISKRLWKVLNYVNGANSDGPHIKFTVTSTRRMFPTTPYVLQHQLVYIFNYVLYYLWKLLNINNWSVIRKKCFFKK